ncbi:GNAT family N-acetyltransferase [Vibrio anguillarum]|uniref:GNAT family N-acetyltransferase n=1 Tax=Vibrio anguillarum TaxID=55601 RepID=UPI0030EB5450
MITIREMDISDYDSVIDLWCQTESLSLRDADFKQSIESYLNRNSGLSFVALSGNKIIGAVLVGTDGRRGYLQHLAVSSEFRGQKIGKALVEKSVDALTSIGVSKTHLFVYSNNVNAQDFYEKLGWFPRDEIRMYSFNNSSNPNV